MGEDGDAAGLFEALEDGGEGCHEGLRKSGTEEHGAA